MNTPKIYSKNPNAKELEIPFSMIPNFALDTIHMRSSAENCLYFVILRQTVGYMNPNGTRKERADLSISRLSKLTGLSRQGVLNSRRKLYESGWILYRLNSVMTSYAVIDRYLEFSRPMESTELTEGGQLSRPMESTELTEGGQLSRHIKEIEIKVINKEIKETQKSKINDSKLIQGQPLTPPKKIEPKCNINPSEINERLKTINQKLGFDYIESTDSNKILNRACKKIKNFDTLLDKTLSRLDSISDYQIDKYSCIRQSVNIQNLTDFNCSLMSKIEGEFNRVVKSKINTSNEGF